MCASLVRALIHSNVAGVVKPLSGGTPMSDFMRATNTSMNKTWHLTIMYNMIKCFKKHFLSYHFVGCKLHFLKCIETKQNIQVLHPVLFKYQTTTQSWYEFSNQTVDVLHFVGLIDAFQTLKILSLDKWARDNLAELQWAINTHKQ